VTNNQEAAKIALGYASFVAIVFDEFQTGFERLTVLFDVSGLSVGGADPRGTPPEYVWFPIQPKVVTTDANTFADNPRDHAFDERQRGRTVFRRVQATAGPEFLSRESHRALPGTFARINYVVQAATPFALALVWWF
jgi:hypothetical protein